MPKHYGSATKTTKEPSAAAKARAAAALKKARAKTEALRAAGVTTREPSPEAKARAAAALKRARAAREATRNTTSGATQSRNRMSSTSPKSNRSKLDDFLTKKQKVPSRNKPGSVPPDYDVILPGMGYTKPTKNKQPKKIKKK